MEPESRRLFATESFGGRAVYRLHAVTVAAGILLVLYYRATHVPPAGEGRAAWLGMLAAELWYSFYWVITQSVRWNPVRRRPFRERLAARYGERLPCVDIFVCTADPQSEPPSLVISTILSVMAYDYQAEKLSVYLSDDGGSILTFYAMWEASSFAKHWLPFCKRYNIEPRSPAAYFSESDGLQDLCTPKERSLIKDMYDEMTERIDTVVMSGKIPEEIKANHKGFDEWNLEINSKDHQPIVQIRVSSVISNSPIVMNVDCDMYSNNKDTIRDALCFFLDEEMGKKIGFVQYPQSYNNMTKNDIYGNSMKVISKVELCGSDSVGGPLYIGTGCFHRRKILCGMKYAKDYKEDWDGGIREKLQENIYDIEDKAKSLATCTYEHDTQWGHEIGLKYGCPVEDVITGLAIHCRGWESVCNSPTIPAFMGVGPSTLAQTLLQHKRWSEGNLTIFLSKYCPFLFGYGKMKLRHQMGYCIYGLWAPNSLATLYYVIIPPLALLKDNPLFPEITSPWITPFICVFSVKNMYSLYEALSCGETLKGWWNGQRMWLVKRITSYLYGVIDTLCKLLGLSQMTFAVSSKVSDEDVSKRYELEIMEFGSPTPEYVIIATISLLNLVCLVGGLHHIMKGGWNVLSPQIILCSMLVIINIPFYEAIFLRKDKGRIPFLVTLASIGFVVLAILVEILVPIV
ncbi:unnamed protein product [Alopecurus aequalis]